MKNNPQENFPAADLSRLPDSPFFEKQNSQPIGKKFIVFFLDDELFAVSAAQVAEVVHPPAITPLPNVPEWLLGIANLRGEILTVADLSRLWNKQSFGRPMKPKLIVLRGNNASASIAFTVDRLSEIITLPDDEIELCEENPLYIFGKASHQSNVLNLLDTEKLVSSLELQE
jgi:purine-binding chemotaxis protein CheW